MEYSPYLDLIRDLETLKRIVRDYEREIQPATQPQLAGIQTRVGNIRVMVSPALLSRAS